jgi:hypothetical protein
VTISDADLRDRLDARAGVAEGVNLGHLAQAAAGQRRRPLPTARVVGGLSAAASVVLALAIGGAVVLRSAPAATPSAAASAVATSTAPSLATSPVEPAIAPWTEVVWSAGDRAAFDLSGSTVVADGIADGDGFMAVGYSSVREGGREDWVGRIWRSADGVSWRLTEGEWLTDVVLTRILRTSDRFVILGQHRPRAAGDSIARSTGTIVWSSTDGETWEPATPDGAEYLGTILATAGPPGILLSAQGEGGLGLPYYLVADTELNWQQFDRSWPPDARIRAVAASRDGWIAVGAAGAGNPTTMRPGGTVGSIWTSPDGATWSPATVDQPGGVIDGIAPVGGGYLAYGDDEGLPCDGCLGGPIRIERELPTWFSTDGDSWGRQMTLHSGPSILTGQIVGFSGPRVVAGDGRVIVIGSTEDGMMAIQETTDGMTWRDVEVRYVVAASEEVGSTFQGINGPVIVGRNGIVAFDDRATVFGQSPFPWSAVGGPGSVGPLATFPPLTFPTPNDVTCPNQLPCDDNSRP